MREHTLLYFFAFILFLSACASIGNPDGGRYDETPPKVVLCTPTDRAINSDKKKISILFNEFIKLENANEKVIVSPPQIEAANIRADGKKVKVDLFDTLKANTTYTIDFGDAIEDNNEGNPMGMYTYSFSTGDQIDTMEIAGTVLNAADLEPIKGILVGLFPADSTFSDTLFTTTPFTRVSRTNGSGQFTIKGVKPGSYRAFALKDVDGNFIFNQKSEIIAFDTTVWTTSCGPDLRNDTVWRDSTKWDSIRVVPYTHFYPDNVVLKAFLEEGQDQHLLKTERAVPEHFELYFTAPSDTLPTLKGLNFNDSCLFVEYTEHFDTLKYWVTDTMFSYQQDTLVFTLTYLETDTLGQLTPRTDTLEMSPKLTHEKQQKERQKQIDEWNKEREKKLKKAKEPLPYEENPFLKTFIEIKSKPTGSIDPNQNIRFTSSEPIANVDSTKLHFYIKQDSDWIAEPYFFIPDETNPSVYTLYAEWRPKQQYRFEADSAAFMSILGHGSKAIKSEAKVRELSEYGRLTVPVGLPDSNVVVQIVGKSDKVLYEQKADSTGTADFFFLKPSEYYLRCYIDRNDNGKWDTGNYALGLQPEEMFYFPKMITIKADWETTQAGWYPRSIKTTEQKAKEITKQKPDKEKSVKDKNKKREEEMKKAKSGKGGKSTSSGRTSSSAGGSSGRAPASRRTATNR